MTREEYIAQAREILDLWTAPWSDEKWKRWNEIMGSYCPLDPELVIRKVQALLGNAERATPAAGLPEYEAFVKLYESVYMATQTKPSVLDEFKVMQAARRLGAS